jgi:hypothetical protein
MFLVVGSVLVVISRNTKNIIRQQRQLIDAQKDRLDLLEQSHVENVKQIGTLSGEIQAYKDLPLREIAASLKELASNQKSMIRILNKEVPR